jgi:SNF2 family DNA or RNA helicase
VFLGVLYRAKKLKQAIIAVPATLLDYWKAEI